MEDKTFVKEWDSENKMKINFIKGNGSLITIEMKKNTPYEKEMDELSKMFSNRRLDSLVLQVLKDKGFQEQT
ncbi:MAG: hypothetical protein OXM55_07800 [Bdellovibrionales bacterium]|nr:hypothetical protein [Bdellovibrionales bacterium]